MKNWIKNCIDWLKNYYAMEEFDNRRDSLDDPWHALIGLCLGLTSIASSFLIGFILGGLITFGILPALTQLSWRQLDPVMWVSSLTITAICFAVLWPQWARFLGWVLKKRGVEPIQVLETDLEPN